MILLLGDVWSRLETFLATAPWGVQGRHLAMEARDAAL